MKYQAIIFDMDGTIIDTNHIWQQVNVEIITKRGITIGDEQKHLLQRTLRGMDMQKACTFIQQHFGLTDSISQLMQEKRYRARELYQEKVTFIEGFTEFYQRTQQHQLKIGVATNADDETLHITKKTLKLDHYFGNHVYGISCVNFVGKPEPAIYLHTAQQLNIKPQHCIAIEDSHHGIQAAKNAGMLCIGINTAKDREHLKASDIIIEGYHEIDLTKLLY